MYIIYRCCCYYMMWYPYVEIRNATYSITSKLYVNNMTISVVLSLVINCNLFISHGDLITRCLVLSSMMNLNEYIVQGYD